MALSKTEELRLKEFISSKFEVPLGMIEDDPEWDKKLVEGRSVTEEDLLSALSEYFGVPYVDLRNAEIPLATASAVPKETAESALVIPFELQGSVIKLAMADPTDIQVREQIRFATGRAVQAFVALPFRIKEKLTRIYGKAEGGDFFSKLEREVIEEAELDAIAEEGEVVARAEEVLSLGDLKQLATQAPIVKLVNALIFEALRRNASDIHIEPFEDELRVRFRMDGVLHTFAKYRSSITNAVVARIKVLSGMNIAERRLPQDGQIRARFHDREIDFRVSTVPTVHGEKVVLRILDKSGLRMNLEDLGFEDREYRLFKKAITAPYGMILVTGPTGSGKTTSLYSALLTVNTPEVNIMTVEDPVEYSLYGINQVQVKPSIGLTFASVLRSFLRQDPDIILVGEIRDAETAEIAIQAALTGHLVFSTLHTNDAPSTVTRLVDMGMERFLVSSSVILVIAQRLVRKICPYCKTEHHYPIGLLKSLGFSDEELATLKTYKGAGCKSCDYTGYKGRTALFEIMEITPEIRSAIVTGKTADHIRRLAKEHGMRTLREIGRIKVAKGITTPEEVLRVTRWE